MNKEILQRLQHEEIEEVISCDIDFEDVNKKIEEFKRIKNNLFL